MLRSAGVKVLNILLPPLCLGCGAGIEQHGALCGDCWPQLNFLMAPWCQCCGTPFPQSSAIGSQALCGACIQKPAAYDSARAALIYDDGSRSLILGFKHGDKTESAKTFASWMKRAGAEFLPEADYICPVPLHWRRLWQRRYNQAALLAKALSKRQQFVPAMLIRSHPTAPQGTFSRQERYKNIHGAFALNSRWGKRIEGKRIVLVDDVLTTGATVQECAQVLKRAGACRVDVLTLARVVH